MKNLFKGKFGTVVILLFTVILAGVAVFTALRLYQLRQQPVAPNVPSSIPHAQSAPTGAASSCSLTFTLSTAPPVTQPPVTQPPTSESPGPTPGPNHCGGTCGSDANCNSSENLYCNTTVGFCRNKSCPAEANCACPGAPTATPAPTLPKSGTNWPTIASSAIGILVIVGSLILAL